MGDEVYNQTNAAVHVNAEVRFDCARAAARYGGGFLQPTDDDISLGIPPVRYLRRAHNVIRCENKALLKLTI